LSLGDELSVTDFEILLEHDRTHLRALAAIADIKQLISQAGSEELAITEAENEVDFTFPQWDYEALEVASVSDSSDCYHVGNGVPCWFYNRTGCTRGAECTYSHAPDEKSVRDDLYVIHFFKKISQIATDRYAVEAEMSVFIISWITVNSALPNAYTHIPRTRCRKGDGGIDRIRLRR
jgi:hypothetical protein